MVAKGILIQHPTRITCHTSTLIDHIITNFEEKVTQSGVIDTLLSDPQLIFCTRKIKRVQTNNYKQISFYSLKNYSMENFERELKNIAFPNYEKFSDINSVYNHIVNKLTQVINNLIGTSYLKSSKKENFTSTSWYLKKPKAQFNIQLKRKRKNFPQKN